MLNLFEGSIAKLLLGPMLGFITGLSWGDSGDSSSQTNQGSQGSYDVVTLPQYDFTEPRYRMMNDFITQQMSGLSEGQIPEWIRKQLYGGTAGQTGTYNPGSVGYGLQRQNENTAYGLPGQRYGTIPTALSAAAVTGAGAGPANRAVSRAGQNYAQQAQRIDEFISEQAMSGSQDTLGKMITASSSIPKGPDAQIVQYGGYQPQASTDSLWNSIAQGAGSLLTSAFSPSSSVAPTTGKTTIAPTSMNYSSSYLPSSSTPASAPSAASNWYSSLLNGGGLNTNFSQYK